MRLGIGAVAVGLGLGVGSLGAGSLSAQAGGTGYARTDTLVTEAVAARRVAAAADSVGDTTVGHLLLAASAKLSAIAQREIALEQQVKPIHEPFGTEPAVPSVPVAELPKPDTVGFGLRPVDPPTDSASVLRAQRAERIDQFVSELTQLAENVADPAQAAELLNAAAATRRAAAFTPIGPPVAATWPQATVVPASPLPRSGVTGDPTVEFPSYVAPGMGDPPPS
jgi:hypothetical protein